MKKLAYQKPSARSLSGFSGAEGSCFSLGTGAYSTFCSSGPSTEGCSTGTVANETPNPVCAPGTGAGICMGNGTNAYG